MQEVNWACCPKGSEILITRAFIKQLAKERKTPSTIENYKLKFSLKRKVPDDEQRQQERYSPGPVAAN